MYHEDKNTLSVESRADFLLRLMQATKDFYTPTVGRDNLPSYSFDQLPKLINTLAESITKSLTETAP